MAAHVVGRRLKGSARCAKSPVRIMLRVCALLGCEGDTPLLLGGVEGVAIKLKG